MAQDKLKRKRQETLEQSSFSVVAEIKEKDKVADEEDVEGVDPEGKPNANTPEIVPAKLKHVDAKLKQATHGYFFNKATKFAEDRKIEVYIVQKNKRPNFGLKVFEDSSKPKKFHYFRFYVSNSVEF
jgi:hypothetical protein